MSKTKKRKKTTGRTSSENTATQERAGLWTPVGAVRRSYSGSVSMQSVVFAAMLTLGFLGLAIFFTFFYTRDPDHLVYSGVAALTALGWLILLRIRWSRYHQRS